MGSTARQHQNPHPHPKSLQNHCVESQASALQQASKEFFPKYSLTTTDLHTHGSFMATHPVTGKRGVPETRYKGTLKTSQKK